MADMKKERGPRVTGSQMEELFQDPATRKAVERIVRASKEKSTARRKKLEAIRAEKSEPTQRREEKKKPTVYKAKTLLAASSSASSSYAKASADTAKVEKESPQSPSTTTDVPKKEKVPEIYEYTGRPALYSGDVWKDLR
jgi:hypothetical protein